MLLFWIRFFFPFKFFFKVYSQSSSSERLSGSIVLSPVNVLDSNFLPKIQFLVDIQSPSHAYKRFRSIIRKLAVVFLFVKIQNILIRNVWKTQKFAISLSIRTFKILKVTRILGQISFMVHFKKRRYKRHSFLTNFLKLTESYRIKVYSINMKFQEKIFTIVKVIQL